MSLGEFLKIIRKNHFLNQTQMGDLILRNKDYVYMLENNQRVPTQEELDIISKKLNEPIVMLIMYGMAIDNLIPKE